MHEDSLPPLVSDIANGAVTWQRMEGVDYEFLGYFLSCHLIIEHYLDEYLKIKYPTLGWGAVRLTFAQKVSLLSQFKVSDKYDCIPPIKHLNSIRNKLGHDIRFKVEAEDLLPLSQYLAKVFENNEEELPKDPKTILNAFTTMTCVLFAAAISQIASWSTIRPPEP